MYGIEFYSKTANLISDASDNKKGSKSSKSSKSFSQLSQQPNIRGPDQAAMNHNDRALVDDTSLLVEQLAFKLQHLSKCPEYLIPRPTVTVTAAQQQVNPRGGFQASLTSTVHSGKSTSTGSCAGRYYTDDFVLLSEFSEIEGNF